MVSSLVTSLVTVAWEFYGLPPAEFTAARNAGARALKAADPAVAAEVAALRKPSPAAWVVNLLARERGDRLDELVQIGERMRAAQERFDRDALRRLGAERRDAVAALARAGADLAADRGHPPTATVLGEVEQTLQAGTSDPAAAAALSSGLLVRALRAGGFEPVDLAGAVAVPGAAGPVARRRSADAATADAEPPSPVRLADVRRRNEARREAERAEHEADAAAADRDALDRRAQRLAHRRAGLVAEIAELRDQLGTAEAALAAVDDDAGAMEDAREHAQTLADQASRSAREARASADALDTRD